MPESEWRRRATPSDSSANFLAVEDERAYGLVAVFLDDENPAVANLVAMWVDPGHRGQGIGGSLVDAVLAWCRDRRVPEVRLWVVESNAAAEQLYRTRGFLPTGLRQPLPSDPSLMELEMSVVPAGDGTVFQTERLIFRRLTMDDLDDLARLYADPEVRRYFPEGTQTRAETAEELEWIIDVYYGRYGYGLWATIDRETGAFIGRCGLLPWKITQGEDGGPGLDGPDEFPDADTRVEVEVAYLLAKEVWGKGLGTEAARAIADHAFDRMGLTRLICLFEPENVASRTVAERVGFTYEGEVELDGELLPLHSLSASARPAH